MYINLMSFNIKHGVDFRVKDKEQINLKFVADAIKKCEGEIIGLNEVRGKGNTSDYKEQSKIIADYLGYYWYFSKAVEFKGGPYGNAIISKYPIINAETHIIRNPIFKYEKTYYETRCILKAVIDIPVLSNGLNIFITHLGLSNAERRIGIYKIINLLKKLKVLVS